MDGHTKQGERALHAHFGHTQTLKIHVDQKRFDYVQHRIVLLAVSQFLRPTREEPMQNRQMIFNPIAYLDN